jgi:multiple sugar transport system permease protein
MTIETPGITRAKVPWARRHKVPQKLLTILGSALILAFALLPFLWLLNVSLTPQEMTFAFGVQYFPIAPTLDNYVSVFTEMPFAQYFKSSAIVAVSTTALGLLLSVFASYAMARYRFAGRKPLIASLLLVYMLPGIVLLIPLMIIFGTLGLMNSYPGLILAESTHVLPFAIWLLVGYFASLPKELEEAAMVDGATPIGALFRVVLPLALPGVVAAGLFAFIASWNNFLFAFMFTSGEDVRTLPVALRFLVGGESDFPWGSIAASAILTTMPVALLFLTFQRYLVRGLTSGAVRG